MKTILLISPYWKEEHRWMVSTYKLADLWQRLGYKVIVVCMASQTSIEDVSETLTIHRRKDFFLPDPLNFGISFGFAGYVRRLIKKEKPDLIVMNKVLFWSSFSMVLLRLTGHRVLLLTDALVGMTWWPRTFIPKMIMGIGGWTVGWLVLLLASRIVTFFPQSPTFLRRIGIAHKTQVIPTGIDSTRYTPHVRNEDDIVITYVGRLESVKGVDDFLFAAAPLRKKYSNVKVQVVGWHKEGHDLVEQYQREVIFTGLLHDIPGVLKDTDIFVLPSYSEGLSNALMEAMASACACVATDVGGNRFLIQNGVSGFLYPPGDDKALQAHLCRLIEDRAKLRSVALAARKRIEEQFDWKVIGREYQKVFNEELS